MSSWREYKFSEFVDINPKVSLDKGKEYSFVEMKDLSEGRKYVTPLQKRKLAGGSRFENGDTLFARITPCLENGKISQVKNLENGIGFGSTEFLVFRGKNGISNSNFVHYLSLSDEVRSFAEQNMVGTSGRQRVSWQVFENLVLNLPDLSTQTAIAEILSSLDDKIELNNKINQELENLAQTLFKQWFIDFEFPNENGEPYKSSGGEMVDSELGEIPKGFNVLILSDFLRIRYGKDHKHLKDGEFPLYGSGGIMRFVEKPLYHYDSILIPRKGTLNNVFFVSEPFWSVDTMFYTEILNPVFGKYLFHVIKSLDLASMNVGSAVPSMTTKVLNELKVLEPSVNLTQQFDEIVSSILDFINKNLNENQQLTNLRDTLLPKLISGELEVSDAKAKLI